jgi:glycosyltransferase involved in cell wall biosynthesis
VEELGLLKRIDMSVPTNRPKPLVAVCIPSYNASKFIKKTIESVLDSTYQNFEIIVNDDASSDNTEDIVKSIDDERIVFFKNKENLGVPRNWNCSVKRASGKYIGLLNHDDLYGPFWLTFAIHVLEKYPHIGWVATAYQVINSNDQALQIVSHFAETREYNRSEAFLRIAKLDGLGPGAIVRREILDDVGFYDNGAGHSADTDLFMRLASRYPLYYSSKPHTTRRLHGENLILKCGVVDRTRKGLRILNKVFYEDKIPEELKKYKRSCYAYNYKIVLAWANNLLKKNDLEAAVCLIRLLCENGFKG